MVDVLRTYLNHSDLLHDPQETVRQLRESLHDTTQPRSVTTIRREDGRRRKLSSRLTDEQVRKIVAAFEAGEATRMQLAERYEISRISVAKLLRMHR